MGIGVRRKRIPTFDFGSKTICAGSYGPLERPQTGGFGNGGEVDILQRVAAKGQWDKTDKKEPGPRPEPVKVQPAEPREATLNLDRAPGDDLDDQLEIPAFLRRQAN